MKSFYTWTAERKQALRDLVNTGMVKISQSGSHGERLYITTHALSPGSRARRYPRNWLVSAHSATRSHPERRKNDNRRRNKAARKARRKNRR